MIKKRWFPSLCAVAVFLVVTASGAQTNVRLSDITPGTERVTLVSNGNFESGSSGWTKVQDMFAEPPPTGLSVPASCGQTVATCHIDKHKMSRFRSQQSRKRLLP